METKKEHLRKILNVKIDDPGYADMDTVMREYNKFYRLLNIGMWSDEADKIFCRLHKSGESLITMTAKKRGKEALWGALSETYKLQKAFYKESIEPECLERLKRECHSFSDVGAGLMGCKRINSVCSGRECEDGQFIGDDTLIEVSRKWFEYQVNFAKVIDLVCSDNIPLLTPVDFDFAIKEELAWFDTRAKYYLEQEEPYIYKGKNANPYKNLYLYYRNAYVRSFYTLKLEGITKDQFFDYSHFDNHITEKDSYDLKDVAEAYIILTASEDDVEKVYDRIRRMASKSRTMKKFKERNSYQFSTIYLPLAWYTYYRKKNHIEPTLQGPWAYDYILIHFLTPLLKCMIRGKKGILNGILMFSDAMSERFETLFDSINDGFTDTYIDILLGSPERLFYRCTGLNVDEICDF